MNSPSSSLPPCKGSNEKGEYANGDCGDYFGGNGHIGVTIEKALVVVD
jgi:hypothetical protein